MNTRKGMLELCLIIFMVICMHAKRSWQEGSFEAGISPGRHIDTVMADRVTDTAIVNSNNSHSAPDVQPFDSRLFFALKELNGSKTEKDAEILEVRRTSPGEISLAR